MKCSVVFTGPSCYWRHCLCCCVSAKNKKTTTTLRSNQAVDPLEDTPASPITDGKIFDLLWSQSDGREETQSSDSGVSSASFQSCLVTSRHTTALAKFSVDGRFLGPASSGVLIGGCSDSALHHPLGALERRLLVLALVVLQQHAVDRQAAFSPDVADAACVAAA